jgi:hypothetical protein
MKENEEKAQFFAQYWGQKVFREHPNPKCNDYVDIDSISEYELNIGYLLLKPLSMISDEDAKKLEYLNGSHFIGCYNQQEQLIDYDEADYLRSKGYALPFRNYTVDQLIEKGWVKLIEG